MREDHRFQRKGKLTVEQKKMLPVIVIPLIVLILMIVIVIADHSGKKPQETEPESMVETMESTEETGSGEDPDESESEETDPEETEPQETEPEETEPEDEFASERFQKNGVPEITDLMKTYFKARVAADAETMNKLYGIGQVSVTALEEQKTKMRSNSKYVNEIGNVSTYVMKGKTEDSWLVYTLADIKFYSVKTQAPMIMWCYVEKNADG